MVEFIGLTPYTVCFLFHRDSVLLIKFPPDKNVWPGLYNGLGGPVEEGESLGESAMRKIREESGIKVKRVNLQMIINVNDFFGRDRLLFVFTARVRDKKFKHDARNLMWAKLATIEKRDVAPDLPIILPKIINTKENNIIYGKSSYGKYNEFVELQFEGGEKVKLPNGHINKREKLTNIIVSGKIGTGTSSLARGLSRYLNWRYISTGEFFRRFQTIHNIPLWDKLLVPLEIEKAVDSDIQEKLKKEKHFVIDAHYGGWLAKDFNHVYKILLTADDKKTLKRVVSRDHTHKESKHDIIKRQKGIVDKFKVLYGHDKLFEKDYFDLEIDTTNINAEEVLKLAQQNFYLNQGKRRNK